MRSSSSAPRGGAWSACMLSSSWRVDASGVARVDFLMDGQTGELYVNEINTIPGSLSYYLWEAAGMSFTQLVDELIQLALKKQRDRQKLSFSFDTNLLATASLPSGGAKGGAKA